MDAENRQEALVTEPTPSQLAERRAEEDAADLAVALPRLERYRKGRARLVKHDDLMRDLNLDVE